MLKITENYFSANQPDETQWVISSMWRGDLSITCFLINYDELRF